MILPSTKLDNSSDNFSKAKSNSDEDDSGFGQLFGAALISFGFVGMLAVSIYTAYAWLIHKMFYIPVGIPYANSVQNSVIFTGSTMLTWGSPIFVGICLLAPVLIAAKVSQAHR